MKTILVVDDEYTTHRIIEVILGKKNYRVLSAYNGLEAVQRLIDHPIDMLITDVNMPFIDGISLVELVRTGERYRNLPILVITASPLAEVPKEAFLKGASAFIYQPFSSYELVSILAEYLETRPIPETINDNGKSEA